MPAYKIFIIHFHLTNFCSINLKNNFTIILSAMIIFERQRRWYQLQLPKLLIIKLYNSKPLPSNLHRNSHNHTNHNNAPKYFKSQIIIRHHPDQRYFLAVEDVRHVDFSIQATQKTSFDMLSIKPPLPLQPLVSPKSYFPSPAESL